MAREGESSVFMGETDVYEAGDAELDQGTFLSGTGHPFHTANTSTIMNLWGGNQPNEVKPM